MASETRTGLTANPEFNIFIFALLLNFAWEMFQMPLFATPPADTPYWPVVLMCGGATVADGFIMLIAFWVASAAARSRRWYVEARRPHFIAFMLTGLVITSVAEILATNNGVWAYAPEMPQLFGIGLSPFLQWVFTPLIALWFTRRQLGV